jgi:hypothetical protein
LNSVPFVWEGNTTHYIPRDKSVGVATGYGLGGPGLIPGMEIFFSSLECAGAYSASYPMDTEGSFAGVKRSGREADHSPPSSAEAKNSRAMISLHHMSS